MMGMMRKLGIPLLVAGLAWAGALQAGAGETGAGAGAPAQEAPVAGPGPAATEAAPARKDAKATIYDLMDQVCRNRRILQRNVCIEHCESQGMWGWYDDPGQTCGYGARCHCVYYAERSPLK